MLVSLFNKFPGLRRFSCCNGIKVERTFGDTWILLILLAAIFDLNWWKFIWWHCWYLCSDWSNSCGDFFHCELVKFIVTILKRNISPAKLSISKNAHTQINFTAKSPFILLNGNPPYRKDKHKDSFNVFSFNFVLREGYKY